MPTLGTIAHQRLIIAEYLTRSEQLRYKILAIYISNFLTQKNLSRGSLGPSSFKFRLYTLPREVSF